MTDPKAEAERIVKRWWKDEGSEGGIILLNLINAIEQSITKRESETRRAVEAEIGEQAREEVAQILNGKSPLFAKPIFDAITLRVAMLQVSEQKIRRDVN